jgi:hypothetical protein
MKISDFFKDSEKWSQEELVAFCKIMVLQSSIDGDLSVNEAEFMYKIIAYMPKTSGFTDVESVIERSHEMDAELAVNVLKKMHSKKKKGIIGYLTLLGAVDGDWDENEQTFGSAMMEILEIK